MKFALKSVPGLADVGVLHGDGDEASPGLQRPVRPSWPLLPISSLQFLTLINVVCPDF